MQDNLNFRIDPSCKFCQKGIKKIDDLNKVHDGAFMNRKANGRKFSPIKLMPDYNASGVLTHWHIV